MIRCSVFPCLPAVAVIFAALLTAHQAPANLLPNSDFAGADPTANILEGWRWDPIQLPNEVQMNNDGSATMTGRKGFLRSPRFPTRRDTTVSYQVSAEVHGKGRLRIETIWWDEKGRPASPHVEIILSGHVLAEQPARIEALAHPGGNAAFGQVRYIQDSDSDDGLLVLRQPAVEVVPRRFEPGELLLRLDAAQPGDSPAEQWQDLAGVNRPFRIMGAPEHDPDKGVYRIDSRDEFFEGALEDESRFDFDTARATGRNDPFTVIVYASLDGPSFGSMLNKLDLRKSDPESGAMLDAPGWLLNLTWNEFGKKRVAFHQMLNNLHDRIISRHGGEDGQSLFVEPGAMHLFVVHVPGDGMAGNIQVFLDGSRLPKRNVPWEGGSLPKNRSITNDEPLRIGGGLPFIAKGKPLFTGTIGFVEIWKGRGLRDGMTPEAYGEFRWNNGRPERGLIGKVR
jgi:hypothetical protein